MRTKQGSKTWIFASMSSQLKMVYPITAVFNLSGYYDANMFKVLIGIVILVVCDWDGAHPVLFCHYSFWKDWTSRVNNAIYLITCRTTAKRKSRRTAALLTRPYNRRLWTIKAAEFPYVWRSVMPGPAAREGSSQNKLLWVINAGRNSKVVFCSLVTVKRGMVSDQFCLCHVPHFSRPQKA